MAWSRCKFSLLFHRAKKNVDKGKKSEDNVECNGSSGNGRMSSPSLPDIHADDISNSMFEDTANSSQSVSSSLKEVDMPVYDDSHDACSSPLHKKKNKLDWDSSPMLGMWFN